MSGGEIAVLIILALVLLIVIGVIAGSVKIVPQARAGIVERLGKYQRTQEAGLTIVVPFIDRMLPLIDLREQVVSFPPQPVITEDNLVVSIDTVVYFQVTDPRRATYAIANYIHAVENLTTTTLRNLVGGMNLEEALTSRDSINTQLRGVLDEATTQWGLRVSRVELKAIDPPMSIQDSMEKQMRAERDRRAAILTAEGQKQAEILTAEGQRESAILAAEGDAQAAILRANAEAEAISTVFDAIHEGKPDRRLLTYQYLQTLPKIAEGDANKVWMIPSELTDALSQIGSKVGLSGNNGSDDDVDEGDWIPRRTTEEDLQQRKERKPRPTTAREVADVAPKAPKMHHTSLEEALAEPEIADQDVSADQAAGKLTNTSTPPAPVAPPAPRRAYREEHGNPQ